MEQIRLDHQLPVKKTDHTSKGDQLKWKIGNIWYKSDYMGYEGLSETLVSHLLQKSTLSHPFVLYQPVRIAYRGTLRSGCSSPDFLKANQMLIPLEKLYRQNTGDSLAITLAAFSEPAERIRFLADQMEHMTGIQNFGAYLTAMLEIDAFFLNEDRHTNNIAVLYDTETEQYSPSPLFDQGLCLFADISNDYPLDLPMDVCMERIEAKPFSSDFDTQLDAAEELYGIQLHFSFTAKDVCTELDSLADYYPLEIRQRVEQIIRRQMRKVRVEKKTVQKSPHAVCVFCTVFFFDLFTRSYAIFLNTGIESIGAAARTVCPPSYTFPSLVSSQRPSGRYTSRSNSFRWKIGATRYSLPNIY